MLVAEFLVADIPWHKILLGTDFSFKFGAVINLGEKCCMIMGQRLPLFFSNSTDQARTVVVEQDVIVPPSSEFIIPGSIKGAHGESFEGMLEPLTGLAADVLVARTLCRVDQGVLPLRVLNVTEDQLMLRKGTTVGTLHTDVVVGEKAMSINSAVEVSQQTTESLLTQFGLKDRGFSPMQLQAIRELLGEHLSVFSLGQDPPDSPSDRHRSSQTYKDGFS